ncbi:MAG: CocE/NonD family hydrolase [Ferrovibrio sp.]|uniref:CocE/NonD family hydrolase n=1 Tax=Ferrovibrio sp. TaxID=1917215 RepID=UPI002604E528|nr:CocE/NonD family hydrolase [Ferrovibrio sp.]MCW0236326.1 CocE/NonD family hydrolase [Ferrovibrio sp.]
MALSTQTLPAWQISPADYLAKRDVQYRLEAPASCYVPMADGCKLAIDVYVPQRADGDDRSERFPTLVFFTPYYRRFKMHSGAKGEPNPNTGKFRDFFVPRGYAVVVVDVRGTGASFGTRDSFRSPRERADSKQIVDWVVAQAWSDGQVGSTGVSYLGAAADFLASTGHPAVKAIAPLFSVWDTYADNYFPGGIQIKSLTAIYDDLMIGLDHDRRDLLKNFSYFANPDFEGPQPVDEDPDSSLLAKAIYEHLGNFRQTDFMAEFRFREEALPYDPSFSSATISPYSVSDGVSPNVAILSVSGWCDGAGYMNGAVARFLTLKDNPRHLLLGPWDHGARIDMSPWRKAVEPSFPLLAEILRFFDTYLLGRDTGLRSEAPIHYFSMHAEHWRSATNWPPAEGDKTLFLSPGVLNDEPGTDKDIAEYKVDFAIGSGHNTRYERIAGVDSREYYTDWQGRTDKMLSFTSENLPQSLEIAGHGIVDFWLASSEADAAIYAYLTEIEADGTERYVTEGLLRALHRKEADPPNTYRAAWPFRTYRRSDAAPMVPEQFEHMRIPLLPVGWRFSAGSRIRLSFAGADADHCGQVPHGRPPKLQIALGKDRSSKLILPVTAVGGSD